MTAVAGAPVVLSGPQAGDPVALGGMQVAAPVQTMVTADGYRVWVGEQVPTIVPGAQVGDLYLDAATGILYRLD